MKYFSLLFWFILVPGISACTAGQNLIPPTITVETIKPTSTNFTMSPTPAQVILTNTPKKTPLPSSTPSAQPPAIHFQKSDQLFDSMPTWNIGLADFDQDGDLDAAFANCNKNSSQIWLNDGSGYFEDSGQELGQYGHGIAVGDVDGDQDIDLVISTHNTSRTRLYLNDGEAVFTELSGAFSSNIGYSVEFVDVDQNGFPDAVGEEASRGNIFFNDGTSHFSKNEEALPLTTIWRDFDSDGDIDFFLKEQGSGYSVWLNDGLAQFSKIWFEENSEALTVGDMAAGDVDNDGDEDVIITNGHHRTTAYPARVYLNDGSGQFSDSGQLLSTVIDAGVSLGDLDGDGALDLVLTDYLEPCQIWLNDGNGYFLDSGFRFGDGQFYRHAVLGDLDGDGDVDIFLSTFGTREGPNEIWFNQTISE